MNENYEPSTLDAMVGRYNYLNFDPQNTVQLATNGLGLMPSVTGAIGMYTPTQFAPLPTANVSNPYTVDIPSTANIDALVARANAIKPQAQPASRAPQRSSNMAYTMGPSVTTSATNIPGQVQVNLNQQHMRFADPEYQRLYALQEARAREALARQGVSYPTAMNHARSGTSY